MDAPKASDQREMIELRQMGDGLSATVLVEIIYPEEFCRGGDRASFLHDDRPLNAEAIETGTSVNDDLNLGKSGQARRDAWRIYPLPPDSTEPSRFVDPFTKYVAERFAQNHVYGSWFQVRVYNLKSGMLLSDQKLPDAQPQTLRDVLGVSADES